MPPRKPMGLGTIYTPKKISWQTILQPLLDAHEARLTDIERNLGLGYPFTIKHEHNVIFICYRDRLHAVRPGHSPDPTTYYSESITSYTLVTEQGLMNKHHEFTLLPW
jgi:hypothetical protein